jgi:hypothetical protein
MLFFGLGSTITVGYLGPTLLQHPLSPASANYLVLDRLFQLLRMEQMDLLLVIDSVPEPVCPCPDLTLRSPSKTIASCRATAQCSLNLARKARDSFSSSCSSIFLLMLPLPIMKSMMCANASLAGLSGLAGVVGSPSFTSFQQLSSTAHWSRLDHNCFIPSRRLNRLRSSFRPSPDTQHTGGLHQLLSLSPTSATS